MTVDLEISKGHITSVDDEDSDLIARPVRLVFNKGERPYVMCAELLHRAIIERVLGRPLLEGEYVDHIDNNPLNNRRDNLRLANKSQNAANRRKQSNNTSGFKGVWFAKDRMKWRADIYHNDKRIPLGQFDTAEEAHEAYKKAARKYHGEFARYE